MKFLLPLFVIFAVQIDAERGAYVFFRRILREVLSAQLHVLVDLYEVRKETLDEFTAKCDHNVATLMDYLNFPNVPERVGAAVGPYLRKFWHQMENVCSQAPKLRHPDAITISAAFCKKNLGYPQIEFKEKLLIWQQLFIHLALVNYDIPTSREGKPMERCKHIRKLIDETLNNLDN